MRKKTILRVQCRGNLDLLTDHRLCPINAVHPFSTTGLKWKLPLPPPPSLPFRFRPSKPKYSGYVTSEYVGLKQAWEWPAWNRTSDLRHEWNDKFKHCSSKLHAGGGVQVSEARTGEYSIRYACASGYRRRPIKRQRTKYPISIRERCRGCSGRALEARLLQVISCVLVMRRRNRLCGQFQ